MIRIIIEHFGGKHIEPVTIASALIWDDVTEDLEVGNYKYIFYDSNMKDYRVKLKRWKSGGIKGFLRQQKNIWELLFVVLHEIIPKKAKHR